MHVSICFVFLYVGIFGDLGIFAFVQFGILDMLAGWYIFDFCMFAFCHIGMFSFRYFGSVLAVVHVLVCVALAVAVAVVAHGQIFRVAARHVQVARFGVSSTTVTW